MDKVLKFFTFNGIHNTDGDILIVQRPLENVGPLVIQKKNSKENTWISVVSLFRVQCNNRSREIGKFYGSDNICDFDVVIMYDSRKDNEDFLLTIVYK